MRPFVAIAAFIGLLGATPVQPPMEFTVPLDPPSTHLGELEASINDCLDNCDRFNFQLLYRSDEIEPGWFGYGWKSPYEGYLRFDPDGTVVARNFDEDHEVRFVPAHERPESIVHDEVMRAAESAGAFHSAAQRRAFEEYLASGHGNLASEWVRFSDAGLIALPEPTLGVELHDARRSETLVRLVDGYQRQYGDGKHFAAYAATGSYNGHFESPLVRRWDANGTFVAIAYNSRQLPESILDSRGSRFDFVYGSDPRCAGAAICIKDLRRGSYATVFLHSYTMSSGDSRDFISGYRGFDGRTYAMSYDDGLLERLCLNECSDSKNSYLGVTYDCNIVGGGFSGCGVKEYLKYVPGSSEGTSQMQFTHYDLLSYGGKLANIVISRSTLHDSTELETIHAYIQDWKVDSNDPDGISGRVLQTIDFTPTGATRTLVDANGMKTSEEADDHPLERFVDETTDETFDVLRFAGRLGFVRANRSIVSEIYTQDHAVIATVGKLEYLSQYEVDGTYIDVIGQKLSGDPKAIAALHAAFAEARALYGTAPHPRPLDDF